MVVGTISNMDLYLNFYSVFISFNFIKMKREILRRKFSALLMHNDSDDPIKCNIKFDPEDAFGLSSNNLPKVIYIFQDPIEGIIYFGLDGDCTVEFDDIDSEILENIFTELLKLGYEDPQLIK